MKPLISVFFISDAFCDCCVINISDQLTVKLHKTIRHKLENELGRQLCNVDGGWHMVNRILYEAVKTYSDR